MAEAKKLSGGNPWTRFRDKHPGTAQFLVFFLLSNGITVLQMLIMPLFKGLFGMTDLVNTGFRILPVGRNFDGSVYYIFNYPAAEETALNISIVGLVSYLVSIVAMIAACFSGKLSRD